MNTQAERIIALLGERGPVEPVCPGGVKSWPGCGGGAGSANLTMVGHGFAALVVDADGHIRTGQYAPGLAISTALLRYAADLSEYRAAALHAASDKQRKLDAVKAAEVSYREACDRTGAARLECEAALEAECSAATAMNTARREAGL